MAPKLIEAHARGFATGHGNPEIAQDQAGAVWRQMLPAEAGECCGNALWSEISSEMSSEIRHRQRRSPPARVNPRSDAAARRSASSSFEQ
jgi:hypothetical protein